MHKHIFVWGPDTSLGDQQVWPFRLYWVHGACVLRAALSCHHLSTCARSTHGDFVMRDSPIFQNTPCTSIPFRPRLGCGGCQTSVAGSGAFSALLSLRLLLRFAAVTLDLVRGAIVRGCAASPCLTPISVRSVPFVRGSFASPFDFQTHCSTWTSRDPSVALAGGLNRNPFVVIENIAVF